MKYTRSGNFYNVVLNDGVSGHIPIDAVHVQIGETYEDALERTVREQQTPAVHGGGAQEHDVLGDMVQLNNYTHISRKSTAAPRDIVSSTLMYTTLDGLGEDTTNIEQEEHKPDLQPISEEPASTSSFMKESEYVTQKQSSAHLEKPVLEQPSVRKEPQHELDEELQASINDFIKKAEDSMEGALPKKMEGESLREFKKMNNILTNQDNPYELPFPELSIEVPPAKTVSQWFSTHKSDVQNILQSGDKDRIHNLYTMLTTYSSLNPLFYDMMFNDTMYYHTLPQLLHDIGHDNPLGTNKTAMFFPKVV